MNSGCVDMEVKDIVVGDYDEVGETEGVAPFLIYIRPNVSRLVLFSRFASHTDIFLVWCRGLLCFTGTT